MLSSADLLSLATLTLASFPNWYYLTPILNTAGITIPGGVLTMSAASSICAINKSVGPDALFTARVRFTSGTVDIRLGSRFLTNTSPNATYYWAGVTGAQFRIGKTVDGSFTTLTSVAYTLTVNTWATITLRIVGSSLIATIDDGVTPLTTISANDSAIAEGGTHFVRSGPTNTCAIECSNLSIARAA